MPLNRLITVVLFTAAALTMPLNPCHAQRADDAAVRTAFDQAVASALEPIDLDTAASPVVDVGSANEYVLFHDDQEGGLSDGNMHDVAYTLSRPDAHAPIGVMGDHVHHKGEIMLGYRYMYMKMEGSRIGDSRVSNSRVLEDFIVTPTDMSMEMHMFSLMYAPTDNVTLMAMLPYVHKAMNHRRRDGLEFKTVADGIGDVKLSALIKVWEEGPHELHLNAGLSLPTGSIAAKDNTPLGHVTLPYPMQLGSGTFDLMPGVTYNFQQEKWSLGGQLSGTLPLGRNHHDYSLGNEFNATGWAAYKWTNWISTSVRMAYKLWGNIDGHDSDLNPNPQFIPTGRADLRGGQRVDILLGINLQIRDGILKGHRFAVEGGMPLWQNLDGPQLETDWMIIAGWQYAF